MPFMGKDWRSPGEAWVKTETLGWQRMKLIESQLSRSRLCNNNQTGDALACSWPPKCDYGQHMLFNCNVNSRDASSSPGSSDSGRGNSVSPSPSCSPEKGANNQQLYHHHHHHHAHHEHGHLFPLAFSSPYGSYSLASATTSKSCNLSEISNCSTSPDIDHGQRTELESEIRSINKQEVIDKQALSVANSRKTLTDNQRKLDPINQINYEFKNKILFKNNSTTHGEKCSTTSYTTNNQARCDIRRLSSINHDKKSKNIDLVDGSKEVEEYPLTANEGTDTDTAKVFAKNTLPLCENQAIPMAKNKVRNNNSRINKPQPQKILNSDDTCKAVAGNEEDREDLENDHKGSIDCSCSFNYSLNRNTAPFCPISIRTREVAIYNTISEAFYRLDFCNAVHDIRRFNYVCKLLHLMITQNLTSLSGCATKVLFSMLEQIAREVSANKRNIHVLRNLLIELKLMIEKYSCWGQPIGSGQLWQQHFDTIERISQTLDKIELAPSEAESGEGVNFNELPVEMIREIILRLNDYRDLINSAKASPIMKEMIVSQNVWERLCKYHFSDQQVKMVLAGYKKTPSNRRPLSKYVKRNDSSELRKQSKKDNPCKTMTRTTTIDDDKHPSAQPSSSASSCSSCLDDETQLIDKEAKQNRAINGKTIGSSYVNRTKKIFDNKQSSGDDMVKKMGVSGINSNRRQSGDNIKRFKHANIINNNNNSTDPIQLKMPSKTTTQNVTGQNIPAKDRQQPNQGATHSTNHELDWEDVFHQLRKRFDLKEEYPDCLLLCRHCRCLFWKSIGHPCVEDTDLNSNRLYHRSDPSSRPSIPPSTSSSLYARTTRNRPAQPGAPSDQQNRVVDASSNLHPASSSSSTTNRNRSNVAALSQNFDNSSYRNILRQENNNRQENQMRAAGPGNNNARNNSRGIIREDLVPKHITITPQAFLKFFSL